MEATMEKTVIERAVLVGLNAGCFSEEETATEKSLDELEDLLETAGGKNSVKALAFQAPYGIMWISRK